MKYIALIYTKPNASPNYGDPDFAPYMEAYTVATDHFKAQGAYITGEALHPAQTATSVKVRKGKVETMDGPFAETKEQLGGFYILNCKDLDQAIAMAAMIPDAKFGTVEVRPIMELG